MRNDWPGAERLARQALTQGDESGTAEAYLAVARSNQGVPEEARPLATSSAEKGHPHGMFVLHQLLLTGRGGPVDLAAARIWAERAAEAGHPRACFNLGAFFAEGQGGFPLDLAASRRWYEQAEIAGDGEGAFNLAMLLAFSCEPPLRDAALPHVIAAVRLGYPAGQTLIDRGTASLESNRDAAVWMLSIAATLDPAFARALSRKT